MSNKIGEIPNVIEALKKQEQRLGRSDEGTGDLAAIRTTLLQNLFQQISLLTRTATSHETLTTLFDTTINLLAALETEPHNILVEIGRIVGETQRLINLRLEGDLHFELGASSLLANLEEGFAASEEQGEQDTVELFLESTRDAGITILATRELEQTCLFTVECSQTLYTFIIPKTQAAAIWFVKHNQEPDQQHALANDCLTELVAKKSLFQIVMPQGATASATQKAITASIQDALRSMSTVAPITGEIASNRIDYLYAGRQHNAPFFFNSQKTVHTITQIANQLPTDLQRHVRTTIAQLDLESDHGRFILDKLHLILSQPANVHFLHRRVFQLNKLLPSHTEKDSMSQMEILKITAFLAEHDKQPNINLSTRAQLSIAKLTLEAFYNNDVKASCYYYALYQKAQTLEIKDRYDLVKLYPLEGVEMLNHWQVEAHENLQLFVDRISTMQFNQDRPVEYTLYRLQQKIIDLFMKVSDGNNTDANADQDLRRNIQILANLLGKKLKSETKSSARQALRITDHLNYCELIFHLTQRDPSRRPTDLRTLVPKLKKCKDAPPKTTAFWTQLIDRFEELLPWDPAPMFIDAYLKLHELLNNPNRTPDDIKAFINTVLLARLR